MNLRHSDACKSAYCVCQAGEKKQTNRKRTEMLEKKNKTIKYPPRNHNNKSGDKEHTQAVINKHNVGRENSKSPCSLSLPESAPQLPKRVRGAVCSFQQILAEPQKGNQILQWGSLTESQEPVSTFRLRIQHCVIQKETCLRKSRVKVQVNIVLESRAGIIT